MSARPTPARAELIARRALKRSHSQNHLAGQTKPVRQDSWLTVVSRATCRGGRRWPNLVLDGAVAAAAAVGADRAIVCVDRLNMAAISALEQALAARRSRGGDAIALELVATPSKYVAGEESALVQFLNGGEAKPTLVPPRPFERGVDGRSTLVDNVETLAQIALIARFGAAWWRQVGTPDDPGSALFSLSGAVERPGVYELPLGTELGALLRHAGAGTPSGVLIGGYFGTWLPPSAITSVRLDGADLARHGASLGCGVIAPLRDY